MRTFFKEVRTGVSFSWDDNEQDGVPVPEPEVARANTIPDGRDDKYRDAYNLLIHTYDREVQRRNELRNQLTFTLTAIGFLITLTGGIFGLNDGLLDHFKLSPTLIGSLVVVLFVLFVLAFFPASLVYLEIAKSPQWKYPEPQFLEDCEEPSLNLYLDLRTECHRLAKTIQDYSKNNEKLCTYLRWSDLCIFFIFCSIVLLNYYLLFIVLFHIPYLFCLLLIIVCLIFILYRIS